MNYHSWDVHFEELTDDVLMQSVLGSWETQQTEIHEPAQLAVYTSNWSVKVFNTYICTYIYEIR